MKIVKYVLVLINVGNVQMDIMLMIMNFVKNVLQLARIALVLDQMNVICALMDFISQQEVNIVNNVEMDANIVIHLEYVINANIIIIKIMMEIV